MKRTLVVLLLLAGLGSYVYFVEIKGTEKKERAEKQAKKLISLPQKNISRITIVNDSGTILLRKQGDEWRMESPVSAPADGPAVDALVTSLISAETKGALEGTLNPAEFGLQPPKISIEVAADGTTESLKIGKRSPVGQDLYVQRGNSATIYQASGGLDASLSKKADEFRDKRLTHFQADDVTAVTVKNAGQTLVLRRHETDWKIEQPAAIDADDDLAHGLAQDLSNLRVSSWLAENATPSDLEKNGLKPPAASIDVELTNGKHETVLFGKSAGNNQPAKLADQPQIVMVADWSAKQLLKTPDELRNRRLVPIAPENMGRIVFRTGGKVVTLQRKGEDWEVNDGRDGKPGHDKVESLLTALSEFRANEWHPSTPATRKEHQLNPPQYVVEIYDLKDAPAVTLNFGKEDDGWAVWVQSADKTVEAQAPNDIVKNKWPKDPSTLFAAPVTK